MRIFSVSVITAAVLLGATAHASFAARPCKGVVKGQIHGKDIRARSIRVHGTTCKIGKRVIRTFFRRADSDEFCYRFSRRVPPTAGCSVKGYRCFRGVGRYCVKGNAKDVSWKE